MNPGTAIRAAIVDEPSGPTVEDAQAGMAMGRIVVIDDEPLILRATKRLLQGLGHRVRAYANGRIAVELMRRERADVVLVDLHMDEMDGIQVLFRLLALDHPPAVIVMSGDGKTPIRERLAELGLIERVGSLGKPFTVSELEAEVGRALQGGGSH
jgi:CheY-like chemotaxis protein